MALTLHKLTCDDCGESRDLDTHPLLTDAVEAAHNVGWHYDHRASLDYCADCARVRSMDW